MTAFARQTSSTRDERPIARPGTTAAPTRAIRGATIGDVTTTRTPSTRCIACTCPLVVLVGERRELCVACDGEVRRVVRRKLANREYQRRWRVRSKSQRSSKHAMSEMLTQPVVIRRYSRGVLLEQPAPAPPVRVIVLPDNEPGFCACGRSLNLGRHKTGGDTCGTCKRELVRATRVQPPMYASFEEVARQLEDPTPIDGDPYTEDDDGS